MAHIHRPWRTAFYKLHSLIVLSLGEDAYKEFAKTVDQFTNKIKAKYANNFMTNKKVYKVNVQVYLFTETVINDLIQIRLSKAIPSLKLNLQIQFLTDLKSEPHLHEP